jgi:uncharacterized protein YabE (DUF348 family)/3D (Asp-Asp-Asp) domain-containing protein
MRKAKRFAAEKKILLLLTVTVLLVSVAAMLPPAKADRTTYTITDGDRVLIHTTTASDPETVLGEAGLTLAAEDTYAAEETGDTAQIRVRRSHRLKLDYYGQVMEVTAQGETVAELLNGLGLSWSEADILSVSADDRTCEGMEIMVARVEKERQRYTTVIPKETIFCTDPTLRTGLQRVVTEGADGQLLCEALVTYTNGAETQRTLLSRQVITQPVNRIVALGAAEPEEKNSAMAQIGDGVIILPTGEVLTYTEKVTCLATAYHCEGYIGTTATGTRARVGAIAVDPEVFPYGTRFYIVSQDGEYIYGVATAEDCGSKEFIHDTRLDLFFNTKYECIQFGARNCDVYILG